MEMFVKNHTFSGRKYFSKFGESGALYFNMVTYDLGVTAVSAASWCSIGTITYTKISDGVYMWTIPFSLSQNNTGEARWNTITVTIEDYPYDVSIVQSADYQYLYGPISEDIELTLPSTTATYEIWDEDDKYDCVYRGKVVATPTDNTGGTSIILSINDLVRDRLNGKLEMVSGVRGNLPDYTKSFIVCSSSGYYAKINFLNLIDDGYGEFASAPISRWVGYDTPLPVCMDEDSANTATYIINGVKYEYENSGSNNMIAETVGTIARANNLTLKRGDIIKIEENGTEFIYDGCSNAFLAYFNEYGGYDTLYFDGNVQQVDSNSFNTITTKNRGKWVIDNTITTRYVGYARITKEGRNNLHHLLTSPNVYLNNFSTEAVITNAECEYAPSNDGAFYNAQITFELSKGRIR